MRHVHEGVLHIYTAFVLRAHRMASRVRTLASNNTTILKNVPEMLQARMRECMAESQEFDTSSEMYSATCARITREIFELNHEETVSHANHVLHMYHKSSLSGMFPPTDTLSARELHHARLSAAHIALFVQQSLRHKQFDKMQAHIRNLQELILKHNSSLDRLASRAMMN